MSLPPPNKMIYNVFIEVLPGVSIHSTLVAVRGLVSCGEYRDLLHAEGINPDAICGKLLSIPLWRLPDTNLD